MNIVLKLDDTLMVSLFNAGQLISTKQLELDENSLIEAFKMCSPHTVDNLTVLVRPSVISNPDSRNSLVLDKYTVGDSVKFITIHDEDKRTISSLSKALGLTGFKVVSNIDIYRYISEDDRAIILDEYFNGTILVTLFDSGEILFMESVKAPLLDSVLSRLKSEYDVNIIKYYREGMDSLKFDNASNLHLLSPDQRELVADSVIAMSPVLGKVYPNSPKPEVLKPSPTKIVAENSIEESSTTLKKGLSSRLGADLDSPLSDLDLPIAAKPSPPTKKFLSRSKDVEKKPARVPEEKETESEDSPKAKLKKFFSKEEKVPDFLSRGPSKKDEEVETKVFRNIVSEEENDDFTVDPEQSSKIGVISLILIIILTGSIVVGKMNNPGLSAASKKLPENYVRGLNAQVSNLVTAKINGNSYYLDQYLKVQQLDANKEIQGISFRNGTAEISVLSPTRESSELLRQKLSTNFVVISMDDQAPYPGDKKEFVRTIIVLK